MGHRLLSSLPSPNSVPSNSTLHDSTNTGEWTNLPIAMIEMYLPGYRQVARFLLQHFRIDVSLYLSVLVFLFALNKATRFFGSQIRYLFDCYFISSVHIDGEDDLYFLIIKWLSEMRPDVSSREVMARTKAGSAIGGDSEEENEEKDGQTFFDAAIDEHGNFNFSQVSARISPRFEPYKGSNIFWHTWTDVFRVTRAEKTLTLEGGSQMRAQELDIDCFGRSTDPIKRLLAEIKIWNVKNNMSRTIVRSPAQHHRWGTPWMKTSERPCRPMETVILDTEQKARIRQDINEFLHPSSSSWYASRGIPYRRGYLFHGPPGTGKTSLSFALAGLFGLDIFIIPLMDSELSEARLALLFNELPKFCIVLLEDIDSAGVVEKREDDESGKEDDDDDSDDNHDNEQGKLQINGGAVESKELFDPQKTTVDDFVKALLRNFKPPPTRRSSRNSSRRSSRDRRGRNKRASSPEKGSKISLSGLLNVIDGVAAHEGRVLIMTTNYPEKLDAALIRPGRIDMQIKFTFATKHQIKQLFIRMYQADVNSSASWNGKSIEVRTSTEDKKAMRAEDLSEVELGTIAGKFADELPEETFAPSEVQGYLLMHKKSPKEALRGILVWRDQTLAERAEKAEKKKGKKGKRQTAR